MSDKATTEDSSIDGGASALTGGLERLFEEWAGNPPVEFPDMDKDPMSFWCWKAWQKATALEREACARLGEENAALRTTMQQILADAQAQDVLPEWWPMMERALKTPNV